MVVLDDLHRVGKAEGHRELYLIFGLVGAVPALPLGLPEDRLGEGVLPGELLDIVDDAVLVPEIFALEFVGPHLVAQAEGHPRVDHGLALEHVPIVVHGDVDIGKDLQVGKPPEAGARLFPGVGLLLQSPHILALLKVEGVLKSVPVDDGVEIPAGVLGGAGAQAVETQGVLVVVPRAVFILSAGVELAEYQLPVVLLLPLVPVHRAAPAEVLHLDGVVGVAGDGDERAVALPGLVDGVGEDLKDGVLAAVQPVRAENNTGPLAYPVGALQGGNRFVAVACLRVICHGPSSLRVKLIEILFHFIIPQI